MTALALAVSGRGLVDPREPVLVIDDDGFARGRAAFETLRVYRGRPFRLAEHIDRLVRSSESIGLPVPEPAELERLAETALAEAAAPDAVLRLFWSPGPPGGAPSAYALVSGVPDWIEPARARGQRLVTLELQRRSEPWLLPATKSVSYAVNLAAEAEARRRGADDALFVDGEGVVLEGPVWNVWWREGDTLVTPSLALGILPGETRATIAELAAGLGYRVEEGAHPVARLLAAAEAFTSSSVREVMPVVEVDGQPVPRGEAAPALQRALRERAGG